MIVTIKKSKHKFVKGPKLFIDQSRENKSVIKQKKLRSIGFYLSDSFGLDLDSNLGNHSHPHNTNVFVMFYN